MQGAHSSTRKDSSVSPSTYMRAGGQVMRCRDVKGKCHFVHYEIELQAVFFFPRKQLLETRNSMRLCAGLAIHKCQQKPQLPRYK